MHYVFCLGRFPCSLLPVPFYKSIYLLTIFCSAIVLALVIALKNIGDR
ncbi:hypothetical protein CWATWH8502_4420 [Crocosphaera watsonii WH 8502]|uniref:Uncharacterized protein n=2 Tax=Crocosphaera watsonii TaxID=263511 RepID=T2J7E6_CROWT|nr:hypothetical protein CWATWH8502_4420 [Crocosphaera watsonii WH 8502]CCQ60407.1 hypothetical protein CWATWH0401_569 [Crocosphaera watsonii WH 0401]